MTTPLPATQDNALLAEAGEGTAVQLQGIVKSYGGTTVLHGVDLDIAPGEFVSLLGPSGCGKTTLLRVLAGQRDVDTGRVTRAGVSSVGVLAQEDVLDPEHTVREAVLGDLPEHVWAGDPRIRDVLTGLLGVPEERLRAWEQAGVIGDQPMAARSNLAATT
jgi:ABC-type uncharacterized transport system fused permease/ATPase subunit